MTLMTTDVDRVSEFSWHIFSLVGMYLALADVKECFISLDSPIEITIGAYFLYQLLGVSSFIGLAFTCLFLPLNHWQEKWWLQFKKA